MEGNLLFAGWKIINASPAHLPSSLIYLFFKKETNLIINLIIIVGCIRTVSNAKMGRSVGSSTGSLNEELD